MRVRLTDLGAGKSMRVRLTTILTSRRQRRRALA